MSDERTRATLEKALEGTGSDPGRLEMRASAMMARAAECRQMAAEAGPLAAFVPFARRALPVLGTAAALLAVSAGLSWWQRAATGQLAAGEEVSVSSALLAGYELDAERDPFTAALVGDES